MTTSDTSAVRCSTADREATSARLHTAVGEGRLTMDEVEERLTTVYAARYQHELDAATADLPVPAGPATGWRAVVDQLRTQLLTDLAVLLGHTAGASRRRRVLTALAAVAALLLVGGLITLVVHGFSDGGGHPGFDGRGFEH